VSVTIITYIDTNGATQTLSAALYTTDLPSGPKAREGCIVPAYQQVWPQTRHVPNAVIVRFVAGYTGTTPEMVKLCIKEHVRANYGRGSEDRVETMAWIAQNLWGFRSF
jgi:hypothetical protein